MLRSDFGSALVSGAQKSGALELVGDGCLEERKKNFSICYLSISIEILSNFRRGNKYHSDSPNISIIQFALYKTAIKASRAIQFCFKNAYLSCLLNYFNRSSRRKRGMASNPLFIMPDFFLHFPNDLSYGYLRFEGNGKIPLGK